MSPASEPGRLRYCRQIRFPGSQKRALSFASALGGITAAGVGLRVGYVLLFSDRIHFGLDAIWYELVAGTVTSGDGYVDPGKFYGHGVAVATAFRPPLYPLFLALVSNTVGSSQRTFQLVGCVVGAVTILLIGMLGRRIAGARVGLCAAALAAVYPAFLAIDASVMSETLFVPLVTGCVLLVYQALERPSILRWAIAGAVAGAAVLTRGDGLIVVAVLIVGAALLAQRRLPWPRRIGLAAASLVMVGAVVAPWVLRNDDRLGTPTLATLDPATAVAGTNCPATYYGPLIGSWSFACTQRADQDAISEVALSNELQRDGRHYLLSHVGRLPIVVPVRVLRLWGLYDPVNQARQEAVESRNTGWQVLSWASLLPIGLLALAGFVLLRRHRVRLYPMLAVLVSVTMTGALVYGTQRFRVAAEPMLLIAAAAAIVHLTESLGGRRRAVNGQGGASAR